MAVCRCTASPVGMLGQHAEHGVAAVFSGSQILVVLLCIGIVSVLLWIPVLGDRLMAFLSTTGPKVAPRIFLVGSALLVVGLVARVVILDVAGASLIGLLVLGFLLDSY